MDHLISSVPFHAIKVRLDARFGAHTAELLWFLALTAVVYPVYSSHLGLDGIRVYRLAVLACNVLGWAYMLCKICFLDDNNWGQLLGIGGCLILILTGCYFSGTFSLLSTFLAVFSARHLDFRKICRYFLSFFVLAFLLNLVLLALGILEDNSYARTESIGQGYIRHSLGFGHPNSLGFWGVVLVYASLMALPGKRKWVLFGSLTAFIAAIFLFSNSKAFLASAVFAQIGCYTADRLKSRLDKQSWLKFAAAAFILLLAFGFISAAIFFTQENPLLRTLSSIMSMRIELVNWGIRDVGFSLFGRQTQYQSPVDSLIGYAPIWLGVIPALLYLGLMVFSCWRTAAEKQWDIVVICIAAALYCTMESGLINPVYAGIFAAAADLDTASHSKT